MPGVFRCYTLVYQAEAGKEAGNKAANVDAGVDSGSFLSFNVAVICAWLETYCCGCPPS